MDDAPQFACDAIILVPEQASMPDLVVCFCMSRKNVRAQAITLALLLESCEGQQRIECAAPFLNADW
jgi:hypothetical protein